MNEPIEETAYWHVIADHYQLTVKSASGSTTGAGLYDPGSIVSVMAIAPSVGVGERYIWNGWTGTGSISYTGTSNYISVTMNSDITETASFLHQYELTVATNTGTTAPAVGISWINSGSSQTITAIAPTGATYVFNGWVGTGVGSYTGTKNPATVTLNAPIAETASWTQISGLVSGDFTYSLINNETAVQIDQYSGSGGNIIIPSIIAKEPVTSIGQFAFSNCTSLTSVTIPDSVTYIGNSSFRNCIKLTAVNFGAGVKMIGNHAFYNCIALLNVTIPANVNTIGQFAFSNCTALKYASFGMGPNDPIVGDFAFSNCTSLTSVILGSGVTGIGNYAFSGCPSLTTMNFEGNAPTLGANWLSGHDPKLVVYFHYGTTGYTTPAWSGISMISQYQLTLSTNLGNTTPAVGISWINAGSSQTITAIAPTGATYVFNGWIGTGTGSYTGKNNHASVIMNGEITQKANWTVQASIQYQLTVTANVGSTTGSGLCNHGSMASISATAPKATIGVRYTFNGWTGTGQGAILERITQLW